MRILYLTVWLLRPAPPIQTVCDLSLKTTHVTGCSKPKCTDYPLFADDIRELGAIKEVYLDTLAAQEEAEREDDRYCE
jgi:hypothetical protein